MSSVTDNDSAKTHIDGRVVRIVPCSQCGSSEAKSLFVRHQFSYQECTECGLVRVNPQLTQGAISDIYRDGYEDKSKSLALASPHVLPGQELILNTLARLSGSKGHLLEVGCFEGQFMWAARELGWNVTGTEISQASVNYARENWRLDVHLGTLEEVNFPSERFDAVVLLDVIEHLPDPRRTLDEVNRVLRAGGALYVWTPNFDCLTRRVAHQHWGAVVFPWHLYYFTPGTLERMVKETGFAPVEISTRNWLLDFRDRYAALLAGNSLERPPKLVRRSKRILDILSEPFFAWADKHDRHWGAQMELYAQKTRQE